MAVRLNKPEPKPRRIRTDTHGKGETFGGEYESFRDENGHRQLTEPQFPPRWADGVMSAARGSASRPALSAGTPAHPASGTAHPPVGAATRTPRSGRSPRSCAGASPAVAAAHADRDARAPRRASRPRAHTSDRGVRPWSCPGSGGRRALSRCTSGSLLVGILVIFDAACRAGFCSFFMQRAAEFCDPAGHRPHFRTFATQRADAGTSAHRSRRRPSVDRIRSPSATIM